MYPGRFRRGMRMKLVGAVRPSLHMLVGANGPSLHHAPGRSRGMHTQLVGANRPPMHKLVGAMKPLLHDVLRLLSQPRALRWSAAAPMGHHCALRPGRFRGPRTQLVRTALAPCAPFASAACARNWSAPTGRLRPSWSAATTADRRSADR
eukprot:jgi/Tetstr1/447679/TSEL_035037.t1